ncbi:hypothetical protein [Amycolatopsis sp. cg9]|uniref:hypothetical protein n=1 Tax=Amycolatopsis sp. cg9 TaxID=3238801 RepID=UPI0035254AD8
MTDAGERPRPTEEPEEAVPADHGSEAVDRGLAPPSEVPVITSTHPLDRGLAPPDEEETAPGR